MTDPSRAALADRRRYLDASRKADDLRKQLERANRIIGWMVPYIGSMCPPPNGLFDLNEHCMDNRIGHKQEKSTKGRPINQRPEHQHD